MGVVAVYDACVLYPPSLRDFLVRLAWRGLVQARWTDRILEEMVRSILANEPTLTRERLEHTRQLMCEAVLDCMVTGHEDLIEGLELPDKDDRHVLAAAVHSGAKVIVTSNLKDFPAAVLGEHGVRAVTPDDFVLPLVGESFQAVAQVVREHAQALRAPPCTVPELLDRLAAGWLPKTVAELGAQGLGSERFAPQRPGGT